MFFCASDSGSGIAWDLEESDSVLKTDVFEGVDDLEPHPTHGTEAKIVINVRFIFSKSRSQLIRIYLRTYESQLILNNAAYQKTIRYTKQ